MASRATDPVRLYVAAVVACNIVGAALLWLARRLMPH